MERHVAKDPSRQFQFQMAGVVAFQFHRLAGGTVAHRYGGKNQLPVPNGIGRKVVVAQEYGDKRSRSVDS